MIPVITPPLEKTHCRNRPRSIYQYSNMAPRLSGSNFYIWCCFLCIQVSFGIERQKKLKKFTILTRKPRSHVRILIYRTWPIGPPSPLSSCRCINSSDKWSFFMHVVEPQYLALGYLKVLAILNTDHFSFSFTYYLLSWTPDIFSDYFLVPLEG